MQWMTAPGYTSYPDALARMDAQVRAMRDGNADELVWLVEHPPLYTTGTSAMLSDVLSHQFPVYQSGRGGQVTYHGPGQRVVYLMLDLNKRGKDVRAYVQQLEAWIIATLAQFGVDGFTRDGRIGVWVDEQFGARNDAREGGQATPLRSASAAIPPRSGGSAYRPTHGSAAMPSEKKIAALGVRVQGWVTSHGIAINNTPDLSHYAGIVPCGIREFGVTSLAALGVQVSMQELDDALAMAFSAVFGTKPSAAV